MHQPTVSIVIDNYNYGRFLRAAIDSALAQTYPKTEVIVVDDGSTDGSPDLVKSYGSLVQPVLKENGGQASALNAGFLASSGEVVIFLDADDTLEPTAADRVVAAMQPGTAKVHFRLATVDAQGKALGQTNPPGDRPLHHGSAVTSLITRGRYVTPVMSGNAFARSALESVMPIPEPRFRISADGYLVCTVAFHGDIAAIDECLGSYRIHGKNFWAPEHIDAERLRSFVNHDLAKFEVIQQAAAQAGLPAPVGVWWRDYNHVRARLASLRLDPGGHPMPGDRRTELIVRGVAATWRAIDLNPRRKILFVVWFALVGAGPRRVAQRAVSWLYTPQYRPSFVRLGTKLMRNRGGA